MANQPKKYKKFVATAATATLVASAIVPVASAASLSDIAGNTHEEAINALVDAKVISGYPDGTFKPNKTLTRSDVVKLLGKYLVSQGHSIPTDAVSNPRFSDLTSKSNKELLEYAAVVADAGVFAGSNGKLLAGDQITRENMAIVLVRMINTLKDVSLEEFVASQNFNGDVKDLNVAKAEARTAIQVLDFYDITNPSVANFNPKGNTTRGQFATFLHKTINSDFAGAAATTGTVKAINNTTVEVTFGEEIEDFKALDFKIEGLEVTNAVVKQTDKKTAVLTTAAQKAGTEYTVTVNGKAIGKFTGVSAVIPTGISFVERSQQGVLGQQVTLKAQVTVAEGQSKAGIPVTFNVTGTGSLNTPQLFEATTDANGVASYTYTRYAETTDDVVAYATGDRTKFQGGKVYWATAQQLTIKDVTGVNSLANNDSKVYEINSAKNAGKHVFVTFKENINVTADKVVRTVGAKGSSTYVLNQNNTISGVASDYPYEITTGAKAVIAVKLDANGKANLVLAGTNATVTPVVYEGVATDGNDAGSIAGDQLNEFTNASYSATALQATAPSVSFEAKHALGLTIQAAGVPNAATYKSTTETGGRDYTVTYVDKDGKPAAANTVVQVAIPVQTASNGVFLIDEDGNTITGSTQGEYRVFNVTVKGTEGKAEFTVGSSSVTQYVEPIAFIDNGTGIGKKVGLDATDLQAKGEATHFTDAVTYSTSLKLVDAKDKEIKSVYTGEVAYFLYETVDQNGKPRAYRLADNNTAATTLTYSVTAGTSPLVVQGKTIAAGDSATFNEVVPAGSNKGRLAVTASAGTTASVHATATVAGLVLGTTDTVTATFTSTSVVNVTGTVTKVDKTNNIVTIGSVPYSLTGATYLNQGTAVPTLAAFYDHLTVGKEVSVTKDADGKLVFNIVVPVQTQSIVKAAVTAANTVTVTFSDAPVLATGNAAQFTLDINGNGIIEANEYATAAAAPAGNSIDLTFGTAIPTTVTTVGELKYTPSADNTQHLTIGGTKIGKVLTSPVTVDFANPFAAGISSAQTTNGQVGAPAKSNLLVATTNTTTGVLSDETLVVTVSADVDFGNTAGTNTDIVVNVPVLSGDSADQVASKIRTALSAHAVIGQKLTVGGTGSNVEVVSKTTPAATANNVEIAIAANATAGTTAGTVTTTASVESVKEVTTVTVASATQTTAAKAITVTLKETNASGIATLVDTVTVSTVNGDTQDTVAKKIADAIAAKFPTQYTVSYTSGNTFTITNVDAKPVTVTVTAQ